MSIEENLRLAAELVKTGNEQGWDRFADYFADEEEAAAWREFEKNQWIPAFPDTVWEVTSMTAQEDRVVTEGIVRMTHGGELNIWVKDPVPATNKKVEFRLCTIAKWENGKITEYRTYMNPMRILSQIGATDNVALPDS